MPDIEQAVRHLVAGKLVAMPTETVYGLGADATNPAAVARIFQLKGRPADHPLIVHLAEARQMEQWAAAIPSTAWQLAEAFWPGPLTMILPIAAGVDRTVSGGKDTIGLRVPSHPVAAALLHSFGRGVAAPSANRFGRVSPTQAEHVRQEFAGVDPSELLILEGGSCEVGLESTIVDLSRPTPAVLRPGAITRAMLADVLGLQPVDPDEHSPQVSGSLPSHYAPQAAVQVFTPHQLEQLRSAVQQLREQGGRPALIAAVELPEDLIAFRSAAPTNAARFAQQIYALLRSADEAGADCIFVVPPEESGIGEAIWDRLRKAAAPRDR